MKTLERVWQLQKRANALRIRALELEGQSAKIQAKCKHRRTEPIGSEFKRCLRCDKILHPALDKND